MIVIVESNFVLEVALQQETSKDAEHIISLAEAQRIRLVVPACALTEPFEALTRRLKQRTKTLRRLRSEITQLARSQRFANLAQTSLVVAEALDSSVASEAKELEGTVRRLIACSTVPSLTREVVEGALSVDARYKLEPQDAIVFASVEQYLKGVDAKRPKLFINKDHTDFLVDSIEQRLSELGCKLIPRFDKAREFIDSQI